jgi:hypothetical protein
MLRLENDDGCTGRFTVFDHIIHVQASAPPCETGLRLFLASRRCSNNANVKVNAALTIKPTVTELPTKKRGAYVVSYVMSAIQALKAYLAIVDTDQLLSLAAIEITSEFGC